MDNPKKESWIHHIKGWSAWVIIILSALGYISAIEKQVSLQGQKIEIIDQRLNEFKQQLVQSNTVQDNNFERFQDTINLQLEKMNDKIDQIYSMMAKKP